MQGKFKMLPIQPHGIHEKTCIEERGKPEASITSDIEVILEKYNASQEAYHGGL